MFLSVFDWSLKKSLQHFCCIHEKNTLWASIMIHVHLLRFNNVHSATRSTEQRTFNLWNQITLLWQTIKTRCVCGKENKNMPEAESCGFSGPRSQGSQHWCYLKGAWLNGYAYQTMKNVPFTIQKVQARLKFACTFLYGNAQGYRWKDNETGIHINGQIFKTICTRLFHASYKEQ